MYCNCRLSVCVTRTCHHTDKVIYFPFFPPVRHLMTLCLPPSPAGAAGEGGESAETPARLGEEAVQQGAGRRREGNAAGPW